MIGDTIAVGTHNCYLRSEDKMVAAVGIRDLIVVSTKDAVMVATQDKSQDVRLLVPEARQANIFHMVDALGQGNGQRAMALLHHMLDDGAAPLYLLAMIVRQYRLLLQVKDLVGRGLRSAAIARELKQRDFVVDKLLRQARAERFRSTLDRQSPSYLTSSR